MKPAIYRYESYPEKNFVTMFWMLLESQLNVILKSPNDLSFLLANYGLFFQSLDTTAVNFHKSLHESPHFAGRPKYRYGVIQI